MIDANMNIQHGTYFIEFFKTFAFVAVWDQQKLYGFRTFKHELEPLKNMKDNKKFDWITNNLGKYYKKGIKSSEEFKDFLREINIESGYGVDAKRGIN